jgi:hypothetical protein
MIKKISASPEGKISEISSDKILASPELMDRMSKVANDIRSIAPRSDDFTYFSIVFLKSAEAALLDDYGKVKKIASGEDAWGFFDENWKWHGNVQPLKNNNGDIFPESELKKAAKDWVGKPLCRDHESSSVDGIRGIILDTHYDDKFKQVVGLCALDKVNYPDLSSKVRSGLVRYGSMGTAVEEAICTTCQKRAKVQSDYCDHIKSGTNYGEINVGLKPIEYSLVVQPAERGAVLLKVFASLKNYQDEFINNGVSNVDDMLGKLSLEQAQHLDGIMKTACGDDGCTLDKRAKIVRSFLENNDLVDSSNEQSVSGVDLASARNAVDIAKAIEELDTSNNPVVQRLLEQAKNLSGIGESSPSLASGTLVSGEPSGLQTGDASNQILLSGYSGDSPDFQDENVAGVSVPAPGVAENSTAFAGSKKTENLRKLSINKIMEDIMNESKLRSRAELRRRVAYHQGGSEGVEPNTFKAESFGFDSDKQMHQDGSMGGADGMHPGDADRKEKLSRAELNARRIRRNAYHQGGSEGVEPNTFKAESFGFDSDKQMHQDGSMGGADGMHPGDADRKEKLSRATDKRSLSKRAGFSGPALRTRMAIKRNNIGDINKSASVFEVLAGGRTLIRATAGEIFGTELNDNWNWVTSSEYGKEVCKQVRASGVDYVRGLLKGAQDLAGEDLLGDLSSDLGAAPAEGADAGADLDLGAAPAEGADLDLGADPAEGDLDLGGEADSDEGTPSQEIDSRLADMEALIDEIRDLTDKLEDEKVADIDVNINSGAGGGEQVSSETVALAREVRNQLKTASEKLDESADEISMVAETYDNISKLSKDQRGHFVKLASAAIKDSDEVSGEARALIRIASSMMNESSDLLDDVEFSEDDASDCMSDDGDCPDDSHDHGLVSEAMELRRSRREAILKQAEDRTLADRQAAREALLEKSSMEQYIEDEAADQDEADDRQPKDPLEMVIMDEAADHIEAVASNGPANILKEKLQATIKEKRAEEDRESYKIMLRRAYDVGLEMQRKGLLPTTKTALDKQVDEIMSFDNNAFEAFKRSIGAARSSVNVKVASDLGGINVGVSSDATERPAATALNASSLSSMWE